MTCDLPRHSPYPTLTLPPTPHLTSSDPSVSRRLWYRRLRTTTKRPQPMIVVLPDILLYDIWSTSEPIFINGLRYLLLWSSGVCEPVNTGTTTNVTTLRTWGCGPTRSKTGLKGPGKNPPGVYRERLFLNDLCILLSNNLLYLMKRRVKLLTNLLELRGVTVPHMTNPNECIVINTI